MLTYTQGEDITIVVPFARDDEPFVADVGTVHWSLRDQLGALIVTNANVTDATDSSVSILVPAVRNAIAAGLRFEKRTVVVKGLVDGNPFEIRVPYRITPWLNHSVTVARIRGFCGVDVTELGDEDVDLVKAYYEAQDLVGETIFTTALASGLAAEASANDVILGRAILASLTGMRVRTMKKESDGTRNFERFEIDYEALARAAQDMIRTATDILTGVDLTAGPTLFILTTPVDVITGA